MTYRAWELKNLDRAALRELTAAIAEQAAEELEYNAQEGEPWSEQKYKAVLAAQQKENALLAGVLTARGVTDPTDALTLLAGEEELSDPFLLTDMQKACERIWRAIDDGETIVVFGDYDVDGVTATALLYTYLDSAGADVYYKLPSRDDDGYGLSETAVDLMAAKGVSLIVTVDNGVSANAAIAHAKEQGVDVVVTDMKMPKVTGREVLQRVKKSWPYIPVLIMTAFGSIESAVEVMKYGAFDYITKPFSNDELLLSIHNAAELARAHRRYRLLQEVMEERYGVHKIVGRSRAIRDVLVMVDRAAPSRSTVLITGESGTGKELVARAIHYTSPRKDKPFVSVNCMALNPGVLESELFGHEKGSFTGAVAMRRGRFEQADGGTLFLDEIAELTPDLQVKLLRVLQERKFERVGGGEEIEVDIRVVAATNKDLAALVEKGTFRDDLYYR